MIEITTSQTADSRTCDRSKVTKNILKKSTQQHISDVKKGIAWFILKLMDARSKHDFTKLKYLDLFHKDFVHNFNPKSKFLSIHTAEQRHHLNSPDGVRNDVDLVDVIEYLVDGVMAGMGRTGAYTYQELPQGLLEYAFNNTVRKLLDEIVIIE